MPDRPDRTEFRQSLRRDAYPVPDPSDPETWPFPGPPDFSGVMPDFPDTTLDPETAAGAAEDGTDDEDET
jgi:hypothetical protein